MQTLREIVTTCYNALEPNNNITKTPEEIIEIFTEEYNELQDDPNMEELMYETVSTALDRNTL